MKIEYNATYKSPWNDRFFDQHHKQLIENLKDFAVCFFIVVVVAIVHCAFKFKFIEANTQCKKSTIYAQSEYWKV